MSSTPATPKTSPRTWWAAAGCGVLLLSVLTIPDAFGRAAGVAAGEAWRLDERASRARLAPPAERHRLPGAKDSVTDPTGDTFGGEPLQHDITQFSVELDENDGELLFLLVFDGPISPADSGQPDALGGFIDIDADQNGETGGVPFAEFIGVANTGMGVEFFIDLFSYRFSDGSVDVFHGDSEVPVGRATAVFEQNSVEVRVPLAFLDGDATVDASAVAGTLAEPTDVAPNQGSVSSGAATSILLGDRFRVNVDWSSQQFPGPQPAFVSNLRTDDSGIFYFLDDDNLEFLIKVLDGCSITNHYWVFFAATTDVEFTVTVTDTQENVTNTYTNPLGQPADAVTDTTAFDTCP